MCMENIRIVAHRVTKITKLGWKIKCYIASFQWGEGGEYGHWIG